MKTTHLATHYALAIVFALFVASAATAQSQASVVVELRVPTTLRLSRAVPMVVLVRNVEPQRRVVLRGQLGFSPAGGLELVVIDSQGNRHTIEPTAGDMTLEQARAGSRRVVLDAGHGMGIQRRALA